jgi:histidyl-tRNA synthetase
VPQRFQAPKGTRDILPPESGTWAAVEASVRNTFDLYGFREIRTPIFEDTDLFLRGVGADTDIVGKEMYSFEDRSGRKLTLRPENTASVCRAYVEHAMRNLPQPIRLFYLGPQFRYERPQKGRFRQFHQVGAELLGGRGAESDVEILLLLVALLRDLGHADLKVLINTVGDEESRATYRSRLLDYFCPVVEKLSDESKRRLQINPLRILDSKSAVDQELIEGAPRLVDSLTTSSREHFEAVLAHLRSFKIQYQLEPRLVRGLDYYTNTVFEITSEGLGSQNAICGGGAYEKLVEELGGPRTYGVGFAIGLERLVASLPAAFDIENFEFLRGPVVVAAAGRIPTAEDGVSELSKLAEELRREGLPAVEASGKQDRVFEFAKSISAPLIAFLGEEEIRNRDLSVRDSRSKEKKTLPRDEAIRYLKDWFYKNRKRR